MPTWHAKPFEDETDGKYRSESQHEQQVLRNNQNNRAVNLSAQVQDVAERVSQTIWQYIDVWIFLVRRQAHTSDSRARFIA